VRVDRNKCVGSTICVQITPKVFALDDRKQSTVADPDGDTFDRIREAAEQCPVGALVLEDAVTGEQVFP
jgi:ferredoxin